MSDKTTVREVRELLNALPDSALDIPFTRIAVLMKLATRINQYDVARCNRELAGWEMHQWEEFMQTATFIAEKLGCKGVIFNGEPLGPAVKLILPDGQTNDFAQDGWIVPYGDWL